MKFSLLRKPSPAMVVACAALVMSMAGTGYAAAQINGKNIKKGTVSGKALKKNTLSGTQINESKLGTVPKAANADNAANAAKAANADNAANAANAANAGALSGVTAADFARNANFVRVFKSMNAGDPDITLASVGDISVKMNCRVNGLLDELTIYATTGTNGAKLQSQQDSADPLDTSTIPENSEISGGLADTSGVSSSSNGYDDTGYVISANSQHLITMLEGSATRILNRSGRTCIFGATFIVE